MQWIFSQFVWFMFYNRLDIEEWDAFLLLFELENSKPYKYDRLIVYERVMVVSGVAMRDQVGCGCR